MKVLLTIGVILGAVAMFVFSSSAEAEYYKHVHEIAGEYASWEDKHLQIHGFVEAGSIHEEIVDQATKREFILESEGERILVKNQGPKPDTFKDLAEVVAKGKLVKDGDVYIFEATELMAKCPSKYEGSKGAKKYVPEEGAETTAIPGTY